MPVWVKYLFFQLPGWILAAVILAALRLWMELPWRAFFALLALWMLKDLVLYPLSRRAYEPGKTGAEGLIGARGVAQEKLAPAGYVRVRGELWRAEAEPRDRAISTGSRVRVLAAQGMTLIVAEENREA